jgi:ribonuclease HI
VSCDGSWGTFDAGAAAVLVAPSKVKTCYAAKLDFSCTNNIVEYEALLLGLRKLRAMGIRRAILKLILKLFLAMWTKVARQEI